MLSAQSTPRIAVRWMLTFDLWLRVVDGMSHHICFSVGSGILVLGVVFIHRSPKCGSMRNTKWLDLYCIVSLYRVHGSREGTVWTTQKIL